MAITVQHQFLFRSQENLTGLRRLNTHLAGHDFQGEVVFMVAFHVLILVLHGFVDGFSTKSWHCAYHRTRMCMTALSSALFGTISFLCGAVTSEVPS
ncbi:hypothetical protein RHSIM_RhsimUnG0114400 [Rhododendron simsii]|uniref:H(+)-exporting diphosphatase n=1 Tax=Rhododendron simsii TaxID=118357 RepID=A0A834L4Z3_RHOSS|nr:hypothetical protein RHSIM_RhsimUnG0114400 [Rhododendron simsii]